MGKRLQVYMFQNNLPQETDRQKVEDIVAYSWSEMRNNDITDVGMSVCGPAKAQAANEENM
eukprot:4759873-Prorocentrum_lima.AAC.1